jgi:hypothetical protein
MSTLSQFSGGGIKSNQFGSVTAGPGSSGTIPISSVDTSKAFVIYEGGTAVSSINAISARFTLTNSTTVTYSSTGTSNGTAYWRVIELY